MAGGIIISGNRYQVLYSYGIPVAYIDRDGNLGYETKTWYGKKTIKHIDYFFRFRPMIPTTIITKIDQIELDRSFKLMVEYI